LDDIVLDYGPIKTLSESLLTGYELALQRGIRLSFESLDTLLDVNKLHADTWLPITPTYDARFWAGDEENAFAIVGRNDSGEIVATQAVRVFDWSSKTSFGQEAEALRIFYLDPDRHALPGESCEVTAKAAHLVTGRVALSGGIWFRPDYRGRRLTGLMVRMGRAYAVGAYDIRWNTAVMTESVYARGLSRQVGHTSVDQWLEWRNSRLGEHVRLHFMWMSVPEVLADLDAALGSVDERALRPERDAWVDQRRT
jgi:hypothetical protein